MQNDIIKAINTLLNHKNLNKHVAIFLIYPLSALSLCPAALDVFVYFREKMPP